MVLAGVEDLPAVVDSLGTVASPAFSRANSPSPKAPVAAANPAMVSTIQTSDDQARMAGDPSPQRC